MAKSEPHMIIEEKYAPPYPQGFHAFYPKHAIKAGFTVVVTLALIIGCAIYFQVPTDHNMPPLPDHGAYVPAPEWYLMFLFEPFWYLTGEAAMWRQIGTFWVPLIVIGGLFIMPLIFGRKKARIKDADTQIRAMAEIRAKLAAIDSPTKFGLLDRDGTLSTASIGGLGGILLLVGGLGLLRRRNDDEKSDL